MLPEFELVIPTTLVEALACLDQSGGQAALLAGGTNLLVDLRAGRCQADKLIRIDHLPELKKIRMEADYLTIGSGMTMAGLLQDRLVKEHALPLWEAAGVFANPLIRNRATIGGNLADASPAADTAPPLLALNAEVELSSALGSRWIPLDQFFLGVRQTRMVSDELLSAVRIPLPVNRNVGGFLKTGLRKADAIAVASAAVVVECEPDGTCKDVRIGLGSVAPCPLRAAAAEAYLIGRYLDEQSILSAGRLAAEAASPISDLRASAEYRRKLTGILVGRLLRRNE